MNSYSEKQRFTQWWLWGIILASLIVPIVITFVSSRPAIPPASEMLFSMIPFAIVIPLILMTKLYTTIDETGISYRFLPFHFNPRKVAWTEIEYAWVRKYRPIVEYGGWGIRYGMGGKGMAFNISGNMGLQLVLKTGKRVLIGTQNPDGINEALNQLIRDKKISPKMIVPQE